MNTATKNLEMVIRIKTGDATKQLQAFQKALNIALKPIRDIQEQVNRISQIDQPFENLIKEQSRLKNFATSTAKSFNTLKNSANQALIGGFVKAGRVAKEFVNDSLQVYDEYEKQLSLVSDTTGLAGKELRDFGKEIRDLSKPLGSLTSKDLLEVSTVAGNMGISTEQIAGFSKEIGIASIVLTKFGGDTEKLALSIGKQQSVSGDSAEQTKNYISTLDILRRSTKANELEISSFNIGMGRAQSLMKLSYAESSALGAVFISGGLLAKQASRLFSSAFLDIASKSKNLAGATQILELGAKQGSGAVQALEQILGRSVSSFPSFGTALKTALSQDALATMTLIAENFATLPESALKSELAYQSFGKGGMAVMSVLGEAAQKNASDITSMDFALQQANTGFLSGEEHLASYKRQVARSGEQFKIMGSNVDALKIQIGEQLLPILADFVKVDVLPLIGDFSTWLDTSEEAEMFFAVTLPEALRLASIAVKELSKFAIYLYTKIADFGTATGELIAGIQDGSIAVKEVLSEIYAYFKEENIIIRFFGTIYEEVYKFGKSIYSLVEGFRNGELSLIGVFSGIWDAIKESAFNMISAIKDEFLNMLDFLPEKIKDYLGLTGTQSIEMDASGALEQLKMIQSEYKDLLSNNDDLKDKFRTTWKDMIFSMEAAEKPTDEMIARYQAMLKSLNLLRSGGAVTSPEGSPVPTYHNGGSVLGRKEVPALLLQDEFVLSHAMIRRINRNQDVSEALSAIGIDLPKFHTGGTVGHAQRRDTDSYRVFNTGGTVKPLDVGETTIPIIRLDDNNPVQKTLETLREIKQTAEQTPPLITIDEKKGYGVADALATAKAVGDAGDRWQAGSKEAAEQNRRNLIYMERGVAEIKSQADIIAKAEQDNMIILDSTHGIEDALKQAQALNGGDSPGYATASGGGYTPKAIDTPQGTDAEKLQDVVTQATQPIQQQVDITQVLGNVSGSAGAQINSMTMGVQSLSDVVTTTTQSVDMQVKWLADAGQTAQAAALAMLKNTDMNNVAELTDAFTAMRDLSNVTPGQQITSGLAGFGQIAEESGYTPQSLQSGTDIPTPEAMSFASPKISNTQNVKSNLTVNIDGRGKSDKDIVKEIGKVVDDKLNDVVRKVEFNGLL